MRSEAIVETAQVMKLYVRRRDERRAGSVQGRSILSVLLQYDRDYALRCDCRHRVCHAICVHR